MRTEWKDAGENEGEGREERTERRECKDREEKCKVRGA